MVGEKKVNQTNILFAIECEFEDDVDDDGDDSDNEDFIEDDGINTG